jgi:uncharacterized lipoprotein YddW (UPF0748 family)
VERRDFVERVGRTLIGAGVASMASGLACSRRPIRNWVWVHGGRERSGDEWRLRFAKIREAGIGGVLVSGGDSRMLAGAAHAEDLEFHRWIWTLNRSGDQWVKENHPEWFTVSRNGDSTLEKPPYVGYYQWLCPTRLPARAYLRRVVDDIASDPWVDGVHLDYVRHSDVILPIGLWEKYGLVQDREHPEFDFCYCEVCRDTFRSRTGTDPLELPDPTTDVAWREFRWESVTQLVRELADAVHGRNKTISAAVFPTPTLARTLVRQAWEQWPLDAVFPMLYHEFYRESVAWIGSAAAEGVAALPPNRPLYAGLFVPNLPPAELAEAVRVARDGRAAGVALFEMEGLTDEHLARFATAVRNG